MTTFRWTNLLSTLGLLTVLFSVNAYADLKLNGIATHLNYDKDQFMAALFTEQVSADARQLLTDGGDKVMEVRIVAKQIYSRRFKRMWIESMAINSGTSELEKHAQNMADFANMLKVNLRLGDILRIEKSTASGIRVTIDDHELGTIKDPDFFDVMLRVWIGPVPLSTNFKNQLLAAGDIDKDLRRKFYATSPVPERTVAIGAALNLAEDVSDTPTDTEPLEGTADQTLVTSSANEEDNATDDSETDATSSAPPDKTSPEITATEADAKEPNTNTENTENTENNTVDKVIAPAPKPIKKEKVINTPTETALVNEDDLFGDESDSILDQGGEADITAEKLLSEQLYISKVTRWTGSFVTYPKAAQRKNYEGTIRLTVTIKRSGEVDEVSILEKSKYSSLNRAAVKAVKKASPYPAIPDAITSDTFVFTVPVTYRLKWR